MQFLTQGEIRSDHRIPGLPGSVTNCPLFNSMPNEVKWFYATALDLGLPIFKFLSTDGSWASGWEWGHETPPVWFNGDLKDIPVRYFGCEPPNPEIQNPASG